MTPTQAIKDLFVVRSPSDYMPECGEMDEMVYPDSPETLGGDRGQSHGHRVQGGGHTVHSNAHKTNDRQTHKGYSRGHGVHSHSHGVHSQGHGVHSQGHGVHSQGHGVHSQGHGVPSKGQRVHFDPQEEYISPDAHSHDCQFHSPFDMDDQWTSVSTIVYCLRLDCGPRGVTQVKTYVNMCVRKVFKWTHISEVHGQRIAPFSEPFPTGCTLNSEFNP